MKAILFSLLPVFVLGSPCMGADKYSKEAPKATVSTVVATSITVDARTVASGRVVADDTTPNPEATRKTTTHNATLEIDVRNLGAVAANVTVHWFWVGRYVTSGNWFRAGEGEKALAIEPKKMEIVLAENGDSEGHVTKAAHEHYKSGGNMLGWVVTVSNSQGEIQAMKASESYLQGFATELPPKKRK